MYYIFFNPSLSICDSVSYVIGHVKVVYVHIYSYVYAQTYIMKLISRHRLVTRAFKCMEFYQDYLNL